MSVEVKKEPVPAELNLDWIANAHLRILYQQTRNLLNEANKGLLSPNSATAFSDAVRLRQSLSKEEREKLDSMTDDQLDKLAEERGIE